MRVGYLAGLQVDLAACAQEADGEDLGASENIGGDKLRDVWLRIGFESLGEEASGAGGKERSR